VTHAVQLGVLCFSSDGGSLTYYDDLVVECADQGHFFQYWDQYGSTTSTLQFRYTCFETASFPIESTVDQPRTIPSVAMTLDPEWLLAPFSECYQRVPKPPTLMPSQSPVTQSPVTQSPLTSAPSRLRQRPPPYTKVADVPSPPSLVPFNATVAPGDASDRDSTSDNQRASSSKIVIWRVVVSVLVGAIVALSLGRLCWYMVARRKSRIQTGDTVPTNDKDPQPTMPDRDGDCDLESDVSNRVTEAPACSNLTDGETAAVEVREPPPNEEVPASEPSQTEDVTVNEAPTSNGSALDVILSELESALSELEASQTPHEEVLVSETSPIEDVILNDAPALSETPLATELESVPSELEMAQSSNEEVSESSPVEDVTPNEARASKESPLGSSSTELESAPLELEPSQTDAMDTNEEGMADPPSQQGIEHVPETLEQNTTTESTHRPSAVSTSRNEEQANAMEQNQEVATSDVNQLSTTEKVTPAIAAQQDQLVTYGIITVENNERETRISHEADEPVQPTLSDDRTMPSSQPPLPSIRTDASSIPGTDSQLPPRSPALGSDVPTEADANINTEQTMLSQLTPCTVVTSLAKGHVDDLGESDESCRVHIEDTADKRSQNTVPCSTEDIATEGAPQHALVGSGLLVPEAHTTCDEIEMADDAAKKPPYSLDTVVSATGPVGNIHCDVSSDLPLPQLAGASSSLPSSIIPNDNVRGKFDPHSQSNGANDLAVSSLPEGNGAVTNEADGMLPAREISALQRHHFL
jgi:hypothetical protein